MSRSRFVQSFEWIKNPYIQWQIRTCIYSNTTIYRLTWMLIHWFCKLHCIFCQLLLKSFTSSAINWIPFSSNRRQLTTSSFSTLFFAFFFFCSYICHLYLQLDRLRRLPDMSSLYSVWRNLLLVLPMPFQGALSHWVMHLTSILCFRMDWLKITAANAILSLLDRRCIFPHASFMSSSHHRPSASNSMWNLILSHLSAKFVFSIVVKFFYWI